MLQPPPLLNLGEETDDLFKNAVEVIVQYDRSSPSLLQRRLSIGYARAARLMDQLEAAGVVGPAEGSKPREVLIRAVDELLAKTGQPITKEQEDVFEYPANYKVPAGIKLSNTDEIPWGTPFRNAYNRSDFKNSKTEFPLHLGFDDEGKAYIESLLDVKNLIIAGNPLSQKENLVDTILLTYLLRYSPDQLRFVLNDPTHYLDLYNGAPHLLSPVINEHSKLIAALRWTQNEMDRRLKQFAQAGVRNIDSFNDLSGAEDLPHVLMITFLDFFDVETEDAFTRLTGQGARTGIYNIIVVDHTNDKSLPRSIKNNIPAQAVFRLSSAGESKAIGIKGAESLQPGELLYQPNFGSQFRLKAIFTPEGNVKEVVEVVKHA